VTASPVFEGGPEARSERSFPCLDGLRALAATAVVITHVGFWTGNYTPDVVGRVLGHCDIGVPVFFVLSGFLLSRPFFSAAVRRQPGPRTAAYLWRRALRILPAYWLTVTAAFLLLRGNRGVGVGDWVRYFGLFQAYGSSTKLLAAGLTNTWSLTTEVAFYLALLPVGAAFARLSGDHPERPRRVLLVLVAATAVGLLWIGWVRAAGPFPVPLDLWLPGFAGWFGAGMGLAALSVADPTWWPVRLLNVLGSSLATCWAVAGALFWIATSTLTGPITLDPPTARQAMFKSLLYLLVAGLVVLPLVFGDQSQGPVRRALSSPVGRFLGQVSYGVFLIHVVLLDLGYHLLGLAPFSGNFVLVLVATWVAATALATVIYYGLERPVSRWRSLVPERRPEALPASETATAASAVSTSA
jgi:peptidoglycan/LPS O-acetylase OafA/YrhL